MHKVHEFLWKQSKHGDVLQVLQVVSTSFRDELKLRGEDTSKQGIATTTETKPSGTMVPESKPAIEQKNQQEDTSKCFHCKKKTGIYGFKCKCGYTYCKMHRIPEDHECAYDFATAGQKLLEKNNPLIVGKKHDDI